MPIHRDLKVVFLHIPRTGGTTVEKILGLYEPWPAVRVDWLRGPYDRNGESVQLQHLPLAELSKVAGEDFTDWYKFAFVRNPWDRLVSAFSFMKGPKAGFPQFVERVQSVVATGDRIAGKNCHLRPQTDYALDELDFLGRFETFERDLTRVLEEIGVPPGDIPHAHKTKREHYSQYYDETTRRRVADIYARDIEMLEYHFGE